MLSSHPKKNICKSKYFLTQIDVALFPFVMQVSFFSSLWNHPFFTISCITLIALFFAGIHKRVVAPSMYPCFFLLQETQISDSCTWIRYLWQLPINLIQLSSYVYCTTHICSSVLVATVEKIKLTSYSLHLAWCCLADKIIPRLWFFLISSSWPLW